MSGSHDIRASMSVKRMITDDQATYFAQHEANGQAPEPQESAPHAIPDHNDSHQASSLRAAQVLLSLSQSPRIEDDVPEVSAATDAHAQGRPSPVDQRSVVSPPIDRAHAQGRPLLVDLPPANFPSIRHAPAQARSSSIDLPTTRFTSMNQSPAQARSLSKNLPNTRSTSTNPYHVQARSPSTNVRTTGFTPTNYISAQPRSRSNGLPRMDQPSTDDARVPGNSNGFLEARLERLPVGRGKSRAKPKGNSNRKAPAKKPDPKDDITAGTPETREFECTYGNPCMLGQYTLNLSRKMVSDYFGRNKKATAMIEGKWIMSCRKHYQRLSYQDSWPFTKAEIVQSQLVEIDQIEAGLTWEIKLKNSEEKRLVQYLHACSQKGSAPDWGSPVATVIPDGPSGKKQSSLAVLHSLKGFCGHAKSKRDCEGIIAAATAALHSGRATQFPLFEMIPQFRNLAKRKKSASPSSGPRKKSKSSDEEDNFMEADGHEDDSEDEDYVMEDAESESESA